MTDGVNTPADDDFDDPKTEYASVEHLDGRVVMFYVKRIDSNIMGNNGKPYDRVVCDVVVLNGDVTELVPEVPGIIENMFVSNVSIVPRIRGGLKTDRPLLGYVDSQPSKQNKKVLAYGFQKLNADDERRKLGPAGARMYRTAQAEAEKASTDDPDPVF